MQPFNYARFNLWLNVINGGIIWISAMGLLTIGGAPIFPIFIMIFAGLLVIVATGAAVQFKYRKTRYPEMLFMPKSHNYAVLMRW